jgi:gliding motility-associated-like protein
MKRILLLLVSLFTVLAANQAIAQAPTANFGANNLSACTPLIVQFTDSSTGTPTAWYWNLGNGTSSTLQNPSTTYTTPGVYTVSLTVTNPSGQHTFTRNNYITAVAAPSVNFVANDSSASCGTKVVTFTNLTNLNTSVGSATYYWDFGDGTFSNAVNPPAHTYSAAGSYTVSLVVTNGTGCTQSKLKTNYITILAKPVASFTASNNNSCTAPVTTTFTSTSTGASSYSWDFGDGGTGTGATASHTYTASGSYTVKLRVSSAGGCMDSVTQTSLVNIGNLAANFTMSNATTCTNNGVVFTNTTTPGAGGSQWSFGDGSTSTANNPVHAYTTAGTYTVKLKVVFNNCVDSISKTITVNAGPASQFTATPLTACAPPLTVNFTNSTTGAASSQWIFGNGNTSTSASPSSVTYNSFGTYNVTLISTGANGCKDTLTRQNYVQIIAPTATLVNYPYIGCAPAGVTMTPAITSLVPVTSYSWTFGDGGTGTGATPYHVYSTPGSYTVTGTFTTSTGCVFTASQTIIVGSHTTPGFTANPTTVCYNSPVTFTNTTIGSATKFTWLFGNGGMSNDVDPSYIYRTPGTWTVKLASENNGCVDTFTRTNYITVLPPVADFSVSMACTARKTFTFNNLSATGTSFVWDFGDGSTSTARAPVHTYATYGYYTAKMIATDGATGCKDTAIKIVRSFAINTDFLTSNTDLCFGSGTTFYPDANWNNYTAFLMDYGDGIRDDRYTHTWAQTGVYSIKNIVTDIYGCIDSLTKVNHITVHEPKAGFSFVASPSCLQVSVVFTDTSKAFPGKAITSRVWNFGDGTTLTTTATSITHVYNRSGNYSVTLTVTEQGGCSNSVTKSNIVSLVRPTAAFSSPDTGACTGTITRFYNASTGGAPSYQWDFGDGTTSTATSPSHTYLGNGVYTVRLIVIEPGGCRDTLIRPNYITLSTVKAGFIMSDSLAACPPFTVQFTDTSKGATRFNWTFGNGNSSTVQNPSVGYLSPGTYYPRLVASNTSGCFDTATHKIIVSNGPTGTFTYAPTVGCSPIAVTFNATSNTSTMTFDFDNGATLTTSQKTVSYMYTAPGIYHPRLIISNGSACTISIVGLDSVVIQGVHVGFLKSAAVGCQGDTVRFTDTSKVVAGVIARREWNFGDGDTSMRQNPVHVFKTPGTFNVKLVVFTQDGCRDSTTEIVTVNPLPVMNLAGKAICSGDTAQLLASNAATYQWDASPTLSCTNCANPKAFPTTTTKYYVTGTSSLGCVKRDTVQVTVTPRPALITSGPVAICSGSSTTLTATGGTTYSWLPTTGLSSGSGTSVTANPAATTVYSVTATSNGCSTTDTIRVTVKPQPVLTVPGTQTLCAGSTAALNVSGATTYVWTPTAGLSCTTCSNPTANPSASTTYTVTGTTNGCSTSATITVNVLPVLSVNIAGPGSICSGNGTTLTASGANSYSWTPSTGLSCTNCANPTANPATTTTYTVTGTSGTCTSTAMKTLTVNPKPTVGAGGNKAICSGSSATLTASGAATYAWTPGGTTGVALSVSPTATTKYYVTGTDANGCTNIDSATVTVNPKPVVSAGSNTSICPGGSATLTASGATTYAWSPSTGLSVATGTSVTATPSATTTYTVTGTDANGCVNTANVTVAVNTNPTVAVNGPAAICIGASASLTASGANSFTWTPSTGLSCANCANPTATPTTTTTYTVTGTSGVGCTATTTYTITVNPKPIVHTSGDTAICTGASATLRASGATTYSWTPGTGSGSSFTVNPTTTTKYIVTGTDANGCTNRDSATVTVNPLPVVSAGSNTSICPGGNTTLTATGAATYAWSPATGLSATTGATVTATPAATTTYTVTGTNANGCVSTANVTVSVNGTPNVTVAGNNTICAGGSTSLTASGANSFTWTPSTGLSCASCANPTANPTATTTYTVTGTSGVGCTGTATVTVTVNPKPTVGAGGNKAICSGSSATLTASGAATYAWTPGGTTGVALSVSPTATTKYYVTGTDANGCTNIDSATVTVNPKPVVSAGSNTSICPGGSATLTASGATTYAWSPSTGLSVATGTSVTATPSATTTYTVTGTDANGCVNTANVTVAVNTNPTVAVNGPAAICIGASASLTASGANSFTWTPSTGLSCANCANPTATPTTTTTYTVTGTSGVGCTATTTYTITVNPKPIVHTSGDTAICTGASATLRASGATTYSWTPGTGSGSSFTVNPTTTTKYIVTGTDANGCTNRDSATVTVNPLPVVSAGSNTSICPGGNTTLTATGAATYAWSPATGLSATTGATVTATPAATTTYTVTGTNANGCVSTANVTVSVNGTPNVTVTGPVAICVGGSAQLTASGANTFSWTPSTGLSATTGATVTATPATTTTYTVTGTSGVGCTGTATYTITVNPKPIVDAGNDTAICTGTAATLRATGAYGYAWTPGTATGTPITVTPTATTKYFVTGTDANGCSNIDSVTVNVNSLPNVTAAGAATICPGGSAALTAAGASTYSWTPAGSLSATTGSSVTATPAATTTYTVVGKAANQCSNSATVTVTVSNTPLISVTGNTAICAGGSTTLTAGGANAYSWSPATGLSATTGATVTVTPATTTTYTITGTSGLGCTGATTVTVTVNSNPAVSAGQNTSICLGSSTQLNATGAASYSWSPATGLSATNVANPTANPTATTTYTVTGSGSGGCNSTAQVTVTVKALPTVSAGANIAICPTQSTTLTASGASTYSWSPASTLSASTGASVIATPTAATTYTVTGTAADGCVNTASVTVSLNPKATVALAGRTSLCKGDSTLLTASGASTYSWKPVTPPAASTGTTMMAKPVATTQYTVIGTSGAGCIDSAKLTIVVNELPVVTATPDTTLCAKIELQLQADGARDYEWLPATDLSCTSCSNPLANPGASTTYTVIGTDANGCSNKASVKVTILPLPNVSAGADQSSCRLNSVNLTATGAVSYTWAPPAGLSCTTCADPVASPAATTSYIVTGVGANGCVNNDTVVVNIYAQPPVNAGPDQTICAGSNAQLQASGAATYVWTPAANLSCATCANPVATPEHTASYQVSAVDLHGCRDSDIVTITVIEHRPVSIDTGGQFCIGGEKRIWADGGDSYAWTPASSLSCNNCQNPVARPTETTTYSVIVRQGQCFSDTLQTTITVHQLPSIDAGPTQNIVLGSNVTLQTKGSSDIVSYAWTPFDGLSCSNCAAPVASPSRNTFYQVTVVSDHGCEASDTVSVNVRCDNAQIYMPNTFSPNADGHNDVFFPHGKGLSVVQRLRIYDRWGEVVFDRSNIQVNDRNAGWDGTFRNQPLKPDVFVWILNATCTNGEPLELKGDVSLVR